MITYIHASLLSNPRFRSESILIEYFHMLSEHTILPASDINTDPIK